MNDVYISTLDLFLYNKSIIAPLFVWAEREGTYMKGFTTAVAVLMAVCMLVGMPLSVNVGAADALKVTAAVLPEHVAQATG